MLVTADNSRTSSDRSPRVQYALHVPLGAVSPLWLLIGGPASVGVACWWATQWMRTINLEAVLPARAEPLVAHPVGGESGPLAGAASLVATESVETVLVSPEPQSFAPTIRKERTEAPPPHA
jgi:hypothetical protein